MRGNAVADSGSISSEPGLRPDSGGPESVGDSARPQAGQQVGAGTGAPDGAGAKAGTRAPTGAGADGAG